MDDNSVHKTSIGADFNQVTERLFRDSMMRKAKKQLNEQEKLEDLKTR